MMRRWMLVLVMLIVGTLCSTAFQAQVDTTGSPPGLQPGRAVNPKPFDKFRAPVSGTVAFLFSDRAKALDRKSTRLNSSHVAISYAVFCLKKKKKHNTTIQRY